VKGKPKKRRVRVDLDAWVDLCKLAMVDLFRDGWSTEQLRLLFAGIEQRVIEDVIRARM
jgi:hypothetical protein